MVCPKLVRTYSISNAKGVYELRVAIFDFDGTLYKEETFPLMMHYLKNHRSESKRYRPFIASLLPYYFLYKIKLLPEEKMKKRSMQAYAHSLHGLTKQEVNSFFNDLAKSMRTSFHPIVLSQLKKHQKNGDHTILISGAFEPLLTAAVADLKFDTIIGTPIPFNENYVDKKKKIDHIQNKRKTEKIKALFRKENVDWQNSTTYSDSISDLPILQLVGTPVAVQPDKKLKQFAEKHNWKMI